MIQIERKSRIVKAIVALTPSKSITNRALIIRALSGNAFEIKNASQATDSVVLREVLKTLPSEIDVNDAGTAFRFLTAFLSIQNGNFILTGSKRLRERTIGSLVNSLRKLGAQITYLEKDGFPPVKIAGKSLDGGEVEIDVSESSQFISALLMIAPKLAKGLKIKINGKRNSWPYVELTVSLMKHFGISVQSEGDYLIIPNKEYEVNELVVENDWSSASFWYEVAALSDEAEIVLKGLDTKSMQGDAIIREIMKKFGVLTEASGSDSILKKNLRSTIVPSFEYDFSYYPDLVMPVAFTCASLKIPAKFTGVKNLRIKESDRLSALKNGLEMTGANVEIHEDSLIIQMGNGEVSGAVFNSYNDHRLTMSIAPLALQKKILLDDPATVNKSYPGFWDQMKLAGFSCVVI
jgi:3-phosphoshikimate 1-carboxyvinyltransferase